MIVKYSPNKKIQLSLKDKTISKEAYQDEIDHIVQHGKRNADARASVVIVAYNEGDDLIRNLEYWKKQTNQDFEIILVDNGLDDGTVEKVKNFDVLYIKAKNNLGCCGGRNVGAVYANTDILVFGDADGYNPSNYMENVLNIMQNSNVVAVRGKVLPINDELQKDFMPAHYDIGDDAIVAIIDAEGNSVWRTDDYIEAGGFEDSLAGGEGLVLQYRMLEFYGYSKNSFRYDPRIILYHDYHRDYKKLEYKIWQNTIVRIQLCNKYPFLDRVIQYYSYRQKNNGNEHSDEMNVKIKNITQEIGREYNTFINELKLSRYQNSDLMKNGTQYDFSIIIPCYNLGEFLPKAIDSVFAQTLENIEVIVVDDKSPDKDTQKVLDEIEKKVHVIRLEKNSGVSVARNEGIKRAKSNYIMCLDADDTIEPTYLEKVKNIFDANAKVGIVSCDLQCFGDRIEQWELCDHMTIENALVNSPVHGSSCFRKDLHDCGGGYDAKLRGYEDWDHWLRIMKQGCMVRVIPEVLFNYYVRPESKVKTSNKNAKKLVERIVQNHDNLYKEHYAYVVTQKHAETVELSRIVHLRDEQIGEQLDVITKERAKIAEMQSSKFWTLRTKYVNIKTGLAFVFRNPSKFIKKHFS